MQFRQLSGREHRTQNLQLRVKHLPHSYLQASAVCSWGIWNRKELKISRHIRKALIKSIDKQLSLLTSDIFSYDFCFHRCARWNCYGSQSSYEAIQQNNFEPHQ